MSFNVQSFAECPFHNMLGHLHCGLIKFFENTLLLLHWLPFYFFFRRFVFSLWYLHYIVYERVHVAKCKWQRERALSPADIVHQPKSTGLACQRSKGFIYMQIRFGEILSFAQWHHEKWNSSLSLLTDGTMPPSCDAVECNKINIVNGQ